MEQKYKIIVSAVGKGIRQTTGALNQGFTRGKKALAAFNAAANRGRRVADNLTGQLKALVGAYAGWRSISAAVDVMKRADQAAFTMQASLAAANREFKNVGSIKEWEDIVSRLSKELMVYSETALKGAVARTVDMTKRLGLEKEQMVEVIKRSADLGAGKVDLEGAIERVTAALRGEAESAEYLGLTLNENYVKSWYEANKQTEKAWKNLTDMEKAQVRYQVFLEQTAAMQGRAADSAKTLGGALKMVRASIENSIAKNEELAAAMAHLADTLRENAGQIGGIIARLVEMAAGIVGFTTKYKKLLVALLGTTAAVAILNRLVRTLQALNAAFTVLIGMGMIEWAGSFRLALNTLAVAATAAGVALRAMVAGMAAWGVIKIYQAIKAYREMRDAQQDVARASQMATKAQDRALKSLDRFRDAKLPEDITGRNEAELKRFQAELFRAGLYYQTLRDKLETKAKETTWLGVATEEAMKAQQQLPEVNRRLSEIRADMERLRQAGIDAAEGMKKPAHAVMATAGQLEEFEKQARKTYEYARSQAEKYADKVIEYEEKIKNARMSTADKIRELQRKGLSEQEQWNDKRLQADEKMMAARQALRENDYERAKKLADDAQRLYADLATEVHEKRDGEDVVIKSIEDTKKVAVAGVREAGRFIEKLYEAQKETAEKSKAQWEATADKINEKLEWVARARETDIEIKLLNLASVQSAINSLIRDETKHITVVETRKIKTEEQKAGGGIVGLSRGGRLPGFGGGDRIRALLEAGEFVIRKEAVRKYGAVLFEALNSLRLPQPSLPIMKFAKGGLVPAGGEVITVNFRAGGVEMPLRVVGSPGSTRDQIRRFDAELRKMGLVRG